MKFLRILLALLPLHGHAALVSAQSPHPDSSSNDEAVVRWIRQNAIPLHSVQAGTGFSDLEPLKKVFDGVRIVGLGEASHGTSEFTKVKHRLLEFLVTQMGFTAFAMEAAYSDAQPINDYIVHGRGDRASVLTGQGYVGWDTEEFAAMLDWLRTYNKTVPEPKRVHFYGLDSYRNKVGRKRVLAVVSKVAPERKRATDSLFRTLAEQEAKWPRWDTTVIAKTRPQLTALSELLAARRAIARRRVRPAEYDEAMQLLHVMLQGSFMKGRSSTMAENLIYIVDHERPGTKFVVWAHNWHVGTHTTEPEDPSTGYVLRPRYGNAYYSVALDFDHGSYTSRLFSPPGDFKVGTLPPATAGTVEWYLSRSGADKFFLDLRTALRDTVVDQWLHAPQLMHAVNWAYSDPSELVLRAKMSEWFDGILFVSESTPTHPTANARLIVSRGEGF